MSPSETRHYNLWVMVEPSEDLEGVWVAHCLDLNVVTQGRSVREAFDMIAEATAMVICDDLNNDRDPFSRRAPEEEWAKLWKLVQSGQKGASGLDGVCAAEGSFRRCAANVVVPVFALAAGEPVCAPLVFAEAIGA